MTTDNRESRTAEEWAERTINLLVGSDGAINHAFHEWDEDDRAEEYKRVAGDFAAAMDQAHAEGRRSGLEVSRRMAQAAIEAGYKTDGNRWLDTINKELATDPEQEALAPSPGREDSLPPSTAYICTDPRCAECGEPVRCPRGHPGVMDVGDQPDEIGLARCPKCGGPADNGNDRMVPPNPYLCSKCDPQPDEKPACTRCHALPGRREGCPYCTAVTPGKKPGEKG